MTFASITKLVVFIVAALVIVTEILLLLIFLLSLLLILVFIAILLGKNVLSLLPHQVASSSLPGPSFSH